MITEVEKRRIESEIPFEYLVVWVDDSGTQQSATFTLTPYWSNQDIEDPSYPSIVFDWDSRGEERDNAQSLNSLAGWESSDDDSQVIMDKEDAESDFISVTIAVEKGFKSGIPAQARVGELTRMIWEWVKQSADDALNNEGPNGERPILPIPDSSPSGPTEVERTIRGEFSLELRHTVTYEETEDAVDEFDSSVTLE